MPAADQEETMPGFKFALCAAVAFASLSALASTPAAAAIEYPWCVQYGGGDEGGGGRNCGFVSYDQCMLTARGAGGSCERNLFYEDQQAKQPQHPRKRKPNN
jgi:hypothetical protein